MLSSILETRKEHDKAIKAVREGLLHEEKNIELLFRLGVLLDKAGDKDACIREMRKIIEIDPDHAEALNYIGYTYAEKGIRLDEAMELIQRAIELKPDSGFILDSLGWVYFGKGEYEQAVHYLEKALELTPDDPTINEHLADAYLKQEEYTKALDYYKKALSLNHPEEETVKKKIGQVEELMKRKN
jgi:tetratricopeptide (TPR) repeat protein